MGVTYLVVASHIVSGLDFKLAKKEPTIKPVDIQQDTIEEKKTVPEVEDLIEAIIFVESRGNDSIIGDNGRAVGCLQMHPVAVYECNRLIGFDSFDLDDRYDRQQSISMFNVIRNASKDTSNEFIARNWNGGPKGYKKPATIKYWNKVKKYLQQKYES